MRFEGLADVRQHESRMYGFGEQGEVESGLVGLDQVHVGGMPREEEDLAVGDGVDQRYGELDAVHTGHGDVGDEQLRGDDRGQLEGAEGIVGRHRREAAAAEHGGEGVGDDVFVVDDKDDGTVLLGEEAANVRGNLCD